jgi:hypothetical protein
MLELKRISSKAVPRAMAKAERYRFLNEPREAESICLDVLVTDPDNQDALITLLLALTDQFDQAHGIDMTSPKEVLPRLRGPYERHYYEGIIHERWGRAQLGKGVPLHVALGWVREAMRAYEAAAAISPEGNEDALLRWNACVRLLQEDEALEAEEPGVSLTSERDAGDEMPMR